MNKKILALLLALGMVTSVSVQVFAEPSESELNSKLKQQQSQLQNSKNSLKGIQDKREELEGKIEMLDVQIEGLMRQMSDTNKKIDQTQKDIKAAENDIKKAEDDMKDEKELFNKRMRAMYVSGLDGYLDILLDSKGLNDFISRIEAVRSIAEADKKVIADLTAKKDEVNKKKQSLDDQNKKLLAMKTDNEQKLAKLNENKSSQAKIITDLQVQEKQYASQKSEAQDIVNATLKQIQDIRNRVPKYDPSRGATAFSNDAVVAYAANFLGTTYVYGGTTPSGFDCSGFVQYVYRHFGVDLPRVAADQSTVGTFVSRDQLQPGDLVFFKRPGQEVHHVGMYVGNNSYIHAPQTGDVVKVSSLTRSDYYIARRLK
ncbi:C40 family peptidase [Clostridium sp. YIM B02515]|uniref:C40 family peptidase n=1 Tax=Clostridium rhizosphaerae TaxID=2803861 RepID=A0ABS1T9P6_9CLOT|nr:C40 family peptidase [Clostridium rhizosphaerae]MBL4934733.1 C40 family peptidase [Clostridium rhizosphaerae]